MAVSEPTGAGKPYHDSQFDGTSIAATIKRLFELPAFLTNRDAWSGSFAPIFDELRAPRTDAPMHIPDAPPPTPRPGPAPWGTDCDDPTRRMRRSIRTFEGLLGVDAPPRLHECAASAAPWAEPCGPGTMGEATEWLAEMTTRWKAEALTG